MRHVVLQIGAWKNTDPIFPPVHILKRWHHDRFDT